MKQLSFEDIKSEDITYPNPFVLRGMYPDLTSLESCQFQYWLNNTNHLTHDDRTEDIPRAVFQQRNEFDRWTTRRFIRRKSKKN